MKVGPPPLSITASSPSTAGSNLQQLRLQPKSPPAPELDTGDDEEINRPVHAIDANSVWETPAKVRKTRILAPPTPSSKRRERMMSYMHQNAEAGPSKVPARPISNETPARREDIDRKILLVIREGMNILRRDRPGFEYNGVARNDIVDRIQELIPVLPNQVDSKAIARLQQDGVICEMGEKQHFDLVD
ncbi:hypothetical protein D9757_007709 [Collybiopsis confluens]|uniref:Uncharacterized protein n=1 Tax=Collybiopsis confluens TaxID=2823264 RepID=A0A8H5H5L4_9AGAR|nr:hypothetical protein D9757_007709 [Collybiopsis confluens]